MSLDDLIKNAKEEGDLQSVGMPDDWANWKGSWDAITDTYGITHGDVDMTSAEELSQFAAEKDDPTKDIGHQKPSNRMSSAPTKLPPGIPSRTGQKILTATGS